MPRVSASSSMPASGAGSEPAVLVHPVGHHAAVEGEQQDRQRAERRHQPDGERRVGELEHQPPLGHRLDPGPAQGDELADEEQPEVAVPERGEDGWEAGSGGEGLRRGRSGDIAERSEGSCRSRAIDPCFARDDSLRSRSSPSGRPSPAPALSIQHALHHLLQVPPRARRRGQSPGAARPAQRLPAAERASPAARRRSGTTTWATASGRWTRSGRPSSRP